MNVMIKNIQVGLDFKTKPNKFKDQNRMLWRHRCNVTDGTSPETLSSLKGEVVLGQVIRGVEIQNQQVELFLEKPLW